MLQTLTPLPNAIDLTHLITPVEVVSFLRRDDNPLKLIGAVALLKEVGPDTDYRKLAGQIHRFEEDLIRQMRFGLGSESCNYETLRVTSTGDAGIKLYLRMA